MKHAANRRRGVSTRAFVALLALVLVIGCVAGGTVAWLVAKTDPVVNTFTYGDIKIELAETTGPNYKIVPGVDISKDPKVTVKANSEACWLFVKVEEANWPMFLETDGTTRKVSYSIDTGWTKGDDTNIPTNVYYRAVDAVTDNTSFCVLKGNNQYTNGVVTVSENLTKNEIRTIATQPTLTFTAYAVQKAGFDTAAAAWAEVSK